MLFIEREVYMKESPKSYLPEQEKADLVSAGGEALLYISEANAALSHGDNAAYSQWYSLIPFSAKTLLKMKRTFGSQAVIDSGANTANAVDLYGEKWLDSDVLN